MKLTGSEIVDTPEIKLKLIQQIFTRRMLTCVFLGLASGFPLYVLISLVPAWLRTEGVDLSTIGLVSLVLIPYNWKFVWAPLMDRYVPPLLGRRTGWMLIAQILLLFSIASLGFLNPQTSMWLIIYLALAVAFFSASQDIVIDAYRRELLHENEFGLGNTIHVQAYRVAGLVPGSLGLILADHTPWQWVFFIIAAFMSVGIVATLFMSEKSSPYVPRNLRDAVIEPFTDFVKHHGMQGTALILIFMILYKLGDNMAVALQTPFFIDMGYSLTEIGIVAKWAGLSGALIGGVCGGIWMLKLGINRALWIFGFVQIITILGFAVLSTLGVNPLALAAAMFMEYVGVGLGGAAFLAFIFRTTSTAFAATQLALLIAFATFPRTIASATTGFIVESIGYTSFFILCTALAVPGMLLLFKVAPWGKQESTQEPDTETLL